MNAATIGEPAIQPADMLITSALLQRPERTPNLRAEVAAFGELSQILAVDPQLAVRRFTQIALRLCDAGSAGLSLLRPNVSGHTDFEWEVISGAMDAHEGDATPRNFSPCGLCLDAGKTILLSRPERQFMYLARVRPTIFEALYVPLYDNARRALGVLWIGQHDPVARFCVNDVRIMEQLAMHLVLALKLVQRAGEHRAVLASLESQRTAQQAVTRHLVEERNRRERAEVSENGIRLAMVFKDAVIQEAHHRVKNTLQIAASVLSLHAGATASPEVRAALQESFARLHLLAKVHELLYTQADTLQQIPMPALLQAVGSSLQGSFAELSGRVDLRITSDCVSLAPQDAIPLALLANEAITNAYKHAFPDGRCGEIAADLSRAGDNAIVLRVTDTGVGLPTQGATSGLGLKLIRSFAVQLQGVLTFISPIDATGTTLTLTIPGSTVALAGPGDLVVGGTGIEPVTPAV